MNGFNYKKAVQALNYFAEKEGGKIGKMKVIKLIWLVDRLHLRKFARPLNTDTYFALKLGPIQSNTTNLAQNKPEFSSPEELGYRDIYLKPQGDRLLHSIKTVDLSEFSKSDLEAMEIVYKEFGTMTASTLSKISHMYPEWQKFEAQLNSGERSRFEMSYLDFFENPKGMKNDFFAKFDAEEVKAIYLENLQC